MEDNTHISNIPQKKSYMPPLKLNTESDDASEIRYLFAFLVKIRRSNLAFEANAEIHYVKSNMEELPCQIMRCRF